LGRTEQDLFSWLAAKLADAKPSNLLALAGQEQGVADKGFDTGVVSGATEEVGALPTDETPGGEALDAACSTGRVECWKADVADQNVWVTFTGTSSSSLLSLSTEAKGCAVAPPEGCRGSQSEVCRNSTT
jgi:hypothetical protein